MKNLDLNKYGVREMNAREKAETEGGYLNSVAEAVLAYLDFRENLRSMLN